MRRSLSPGLRRVVTRSSIAGALSPSPGSLGDALPSMRIRGCLVKKVRYERKIHHGSPDRPVEERREY